MTVSSTSEQFTIMTLFVVYDSWAHVGSVDCTYEQSVWIKLFARYISEAHVWTVCSEDEISYLTVSGRYCESPWKLLKDELSSWITVIGHISRGSKKIRVFSMFKWHFSESNKQMNDEIEGVWGAKKLRYILLWPRNESEWCKKEFKNQKNIKDSKWKSICNSQ